MKRKVYLCLGLFLAILLTVYLFSNRVVLYGDRIIELPYNQPYQEQGACGYRLFKAVDVTIEGNVQNQFGTYYIYYSNGLFKAKRTVKVVDQQPPLLTVSDEPITIEYGASLQPYCSATDDYDGDISDRVSISPEVLKLGKNTITFSVKDSYGNSASIQKEIEVVDTSAPVITLTRNTNDYCILNQSIDLSFQVIDNFDGDITDQVIVTSDLDTSKEGIYTIVYDYCDSHGNSDRLTTTVNVQPADTDGIAVLMYHWFYDDSIEEWPTRYPNNWIEVQTLDEQLAYLKENDYYFPNWQQFSDYLDGKIDLPAKSVILTDDDASKGFYNVAIPVFEKYDIPVTSFAIGRNHNNFDHLLNHPLISFQSHTYTYHTKIDGLWMTVTESYEDVKADLQLSIDQLNHNDAFAYPGGKTSETLIQVVKDLNFSVAFTTQQGTCKPGDDKYLLTRQRINHNTTLQQFIQLLQ